MASAFPNLFQQYFVIHQTISALLGEDSTTPIDAKDIERRVNALHPDAQIGPELLKAAIRQPLKDTEFTVGRPRKACQPTRPYGESAAQTDH